MGLAFAHVVNILVNVFSLGSITRGASFLLINYISLCSRSSTTFVINIVLITVKFLVIRFQTREANGK